MDRCYCCGTAIEFRGNGSPPGVQVKGHGAWCQACVGGCALVEPRVNKFAQVNRGPECPFLNKRPRARQTISTPAPSVLKRVDWSPPRSTAASPPDPDKVRPDGQFFWRGRWRRPRSRTQA